MNIFVILLSVLTMKKIYRNYLRIHITVGWRQVFQVIRE